MITARYKVLGVEALVSAEFSLVEDALAACGSGGVVVGIYTSAYSVEVMQLHPVCGYKCKVLAVDFVGPKGAE